MKNAYVNTIHKEIRTESGKPCGIISLHQHGDIIAVGASKMRPSLIDTGKHKFDKQRGMDMSDERAQKAFDNYLDHKEMDDPSMFVVNLAKDKTHRSFSELVIKTESFDIIDEETNRSRLGVCIK